MAKLNPPSDTTYVDLINHPYRTASEYVAKIGGNDLFDATECSCCRGEINELLPIATVFHGSTSTFTLCHRCLSLDSNDLRSEFIRELHRQRQDLAELHRVLDHHPIASSEWHEAMENIYGKTEQMQDTAAICAYGLRMAKQDADRIAELPGHKAQRVLVAQ